MNLNVSRMDSIFQFFIINAKLEEKPSPLRMKAPVADYLGKKIPKINPKGKKQQFIKTVSRNDELGRVGI